MHVKSNTNAPTTSAGCSGRLPCRGWLESNDAGSSDMHHFNGIVDRLELSSRVFDTMDKAFARG